MVFLHRFLLGAVAGQKVDHRDGDGLNCQRYNIRFATSAENARNRREYKNGNGFKGVFQSGKYWCARIRINGKQELFRGFASAEAAARGYDALAIEHFGEFACLNFPCGDF